MSWFFLYWIFGFAGAFFAHYTCEWSISLARKEAATNLPCVTLGGILAATLAAVFGPLLWLAGFCYLGYGATLIVFGADFWGKPLCRKRRP